MAAKKMFPPGEVEKLLGRHVASPFGDDYEEVKLGIGFTSGAAASSTFVASVRVFFNLNSYIDLCGFGIRP